MVSWGMTVAVGWVEYSCGYLYSVQAVSKTTIDFTVLADHYVQEEENQGKPITSLEYKENLNKWSNIIRSTISTAGHRECWVSVLTHTPLIHTGVTPTVLCLTCKKARLCTSAHIWTVTSAIVFFLVLLFLHNIPANRNYRKQWPCSWRADFHPLGRVRVFTKHIVKAQFSEVRKNNDCE